MAKNKDNKKKAANRCENNNASNMNNNAENTRNPDCSNESKHSETQKKNNRDCK